MSDSVLELWVKVTQLESNQGLNCTMQIHSRIVKLGSTPALKTGGAGAWPQVCGETPAGPGEGSFLTTQRSGGLSLGLPCDQAKVISPPRLSALSCRQGGCLAYLVQ